MTVTITEVSTPVVLIEIQTSTDVIGSASPDLAVVEILSVPTPTVVVVQPSQYLEVIDNAIRGAPGPMGPAGLVKVTHGADPDVARPNVPLVYWVGTVQPNNGDPDDLLMLKEA